MLKLVNTFKYNYPMQRKWFPKARVTKLYPLQKNIYRLIAMTLGLKIMG